MNETLTVIMNRRSVRTYKPAQISDTELQTIMEAAINAPNGMNQQKWHFTVVQDKGMLDRMAKVIKENLKNSGVEFLAERAAIPDFNPFYNAPTNIFITADENTMFVDIDCGLAAQNIMLAAASLNIGSCIMTLPMFLFSSEKGLGIKKELGIPDGYRYVCNITLGYRAGANLEAKPRSKAVINYVK